MDVLADVLARLAREFGVDQADVRLRKVERDARLHWGGGHVWVAGRSALRQIDRDGIVRAMMAGSESAPQIAQKFGVSVRTCWNYYRAAAQVKD